MKLKYTNSINNAHLNLTIDKFYTILDTRIWSNGYVQYLIHDDLGYDSWYSKTRFNNRKEKLQKINENNRSED